MNTEDKVNISMILFVLALIAVVIYIPFVLVPQQPVQYERTATSSSVPLTP